MTSGMTMMTVMTSGMTMMTVMRVPADFPVAVESPAEEGHPAIGKKPAIGFMMW